MKVYLTPKTLKKIIKMLILFILACILIYYSNTLEVKADTTTANINSYDITFPTSITWYDYINSSYISKGNSTQVISISNLNDYLSFSAPSSSLLTTNGGSGATLRFNTDIISPNHSYVLYLYLIDLNSTTYSPSYSSINSFELCNSSLSICDNPTELLFSGRGQKSQYENYYITNLIYRFTSTGTASSYGVQAHFSSDTQVSFLGSNPQRGFIGYKLIDVTDYSNTTIEGMIQDNQNSLNQLEDDMVILQETQEATNEKLDEQLKQDQEQHEELKDTIDDGFGNDCKYYNLNLSSKDIVINNSVLYSDGSIISSSAWGISNYYQIYGGYTYNLTKNYQGSSPSIVFYDEDKNYVTGISFNSQTSINFSLPENVKYFRITLANSISSSDDATAVITSSTEICTNKLDDLNQNQQATNDKLDNLQDSIIDSTAPDTSNLENAAGWLPPGPVDSLVNLPINLLNSLLGNIGTTCTNINLTLPFVNKNFSIPCPNELLNNLGATFLTFWEGIGLIAGCWCLYKYFIALYKWVESALTLDEKDQLGKWGGV